MTSQPIDDHYLYAASAAPAPSRPVVRPIALRLPPVRPRPARSRAAAPLFRTLAEYVDLSQSLRVSTLAR